MINRPILVPFIGSTVHSSSCSVNGAEDDRRKGAGGIKEQSTPRIEDRHRFFLQDRAPRFFQVAAIPILSHGEIEALANSFENEGIGSFSGSMSSAKVRKEFDPRSRNAPLKARAGDSAGFGGSRTRNGPCRIWLRRACR